MALTNEEKREAVSQAIYDHITVGEVVKDNPDLNAEQYAFVQELEEAIVASADFIEENALADNIGNAVTAILSKQQG